MLRLDKKVVVLVGGAGMLGCRFTKSLLSEGAILHVIDIKESEGIREFKGNSNFSLHIIDASDKSSLIKLRDHILNVESKIDCLINATTVHGNGFYRPFEEQPLENWEQVIKGVLTITFLTCQVFIPSLVKNGRGSVINISSVYGLVGNDQRIYLGSNLDQAYGEGMQETQIFSPASYNAAKSGVIGLTKYLAAYYGKNNVRVNAISPGGVDSGKENEAFLRNYSQRVPLNRKAGLDEINGAVIFLASDDSTYVTGHNLVIDGGLTAW